MPPSSMTNVRTNGNAAAREELLMPRSWFLSVDTGDTAAVLKPSICKPYSVDGRKLPVSIARRTAFL